MNQPEIIGAFLHPGPSVSCQLCQAVQLVILWFGKTNAIRFECIVPSGTCTDDPTFEKIFLPLRHVEGNILVLLGFLEARLQRS